MTQNLEDRIPKLLKKPLVKNPSLVNPPPMEECRLLLKTQELSQDLHVVGSGDLDVEV
ncbi:unnamed protein product [Ilex paraguariensis]|uniref:Uncharacterized protein n=1 Tax=Ilex paraguariensis TaxID=185542 RepID=A0ABC8U761_9AQUA